MKWANVRAAQAMVLNCKRPTRNLQFCMLHDYLGVQLTKNSVSSITTNHGGRSQTYVSLYINMICATFSANPEVSKVKIKN